jgi:hypothetical protein
MHARVDGERFDEVFSITGAFDPIAASRLRARLAEVPPDTCVVLDFSRAREVADLALAVLAAALATTRHPRVLLRGLTQHQERMLRYLGVDHVVLGAPSRDDRPEWVGEA